MRRFGMRIKKIHVLKERSRCALERQGGVRGEVNAKNGDGAKKAETGMPLLTDERRTRYEEGNSIRKVHDNTLHYK